jgi:hypothetical protein
VAGEPLATLALVGKVLEQILGGDVLAVANSVLRFHEELAEEHEVHDASLAFLFEDALGQLLFFESFIEVLLPH